MKKLPVKNIEIFEEKNMGHGDSYYLAKINKRIDEQIYIVYRSINDYDHDTIHCTWHLDMANELGDVWILEGIQLEWKGDPFNLKKKHA